MTHRLAPLLAAAALAALAACGDDSTIGHEAGPLPELSPSGRSAAEIATAVLGPEGGVIETDFGVEVALPPGAAREEVTLEVSLDPFTGIDLNAHGAIFDENVVVTVGGETGHGVIIVFACIEPELGSCVEIDRASPYDQDALAPLALDAAPIAEHLGRSAR